MKLRYWFPFWLVLTLNVALQMSLSIRPGMFWWSITARTAVCVLVGVGCYFSQRAGEKLRREIEGSITAKNAEFKHFMDSMYR
jgi:hypothetical protein